MSLSLQTGATGLLAQQKKLEVVANNLANLNTVGYKSQRILFSDLLYSTTRGGSAPTGNGTGGTNPIQVGFGVGVAQTSRNQSQGVLESTGQTFDFSMEGNGFFVVDDGAQSYTRAGAFSLDAGGFLVDPATGAYVQRVGTAGEGLDGSTQFQVPGEMAIRVPMGAGVPGRETTTAAFIGNIPATATPPLAEVLSSAASFQAGGSPASTTTLLNDLDTNSADYISGDSITISGTQVDGTSFTASLSVGAGTTLNDIIVGINAQLAAATASLDPDGNIRVIADNQGDADLSLKLEDAVANTGQTDFSEHAFLIETDGKEGDEVESTMQIFDVRGRAHNLNVTFQKMDDNIWDANFELLDSSGNLIDSTIEAIEFTEDGRYRTVNGAGVADADIVLQFDDLTEPQTIAVSFESLTHMATRFSLNSDQDGFPPGNIVSVAVNQDGVLDGLATNGQSIPIAQMAVATFVNNQGLEATGQNYFTATSASGLANVGTGLSGSAGAVRGGQLEASNVDVALEFTQLIVAQRGFSANARTITVANEVLQELTSLIR